VSEMGLRTAKRWFLGGAVSVGEVVTIGLTRNVAVEVTAAAWE
jgi:hypothetical protein